MLLLPWHLSMWTAETGYRGFPSCLLVTLTAVIASTHSSPKKSGSMPMILDDIDVLAAFNRTSRPSESVITMRVPRI